VLKRRIARNRQEVRLREVAMHDDHIMELWRLMCLAYPLSRTTGAVKALWLSIAICLFAEESNGRNFSELEELFRVGHQGTRQASTLYRYWSVYPHLHLNVTFSGRRCCCFTKRISLNNQSHENLCLTR
jgi:hypothetical protein